MDKRRKAVLIIALDLLLFAVIIFSVYMMLKKTVGSAAYNIFMLLIVISIPVAFLITFVPIIGNKYDYEETLDEEEDDHMSVTCDKIVLEEKKENENGL